jgi:hypothetical protein
MSIITRPATKQKWWGIKCTNHFVGAYWDINRSLSKRGKSNHMQWPFKNGENDFPNHGRLGAKNSKLTWYFSCKSAPRPTADLQSPALMANGTHVGAHLAKIRRNETGRPIPWLPTAIGSVFNHNPGSKCCVSIFFWGFTLEIQDFRQRRSRTCWVGGLNHHVPFNTGEKTERSQQIIPRWLVYLYKGDMYMCIYIYNM